MINDPNLKVLELNGIAMKLFTKSYRFFFIHFHSKNITELLHKVQLVVLEVYLVMLVLILMSYLCLL